MVRKRQGKDNGAEYAGESRQVLGKGVKAVNDLSLEIQGRRIHGPSRPFRCGKSTALRIIAGTEEVATETAESATGVVNGVAPKDRDIAIDLPELWPFTSDDRGAEPAFAAACARHEGGDRSAASAMRPAFLALSRFPRAQAGGVVGGQRQRVARPGDVRRAAGFLMDEPLSNLDAKLAWHAGVAGGAA